MHNALIGVRCEKALVLSGREIPPGSCFVSLARNRKRKHGVDGEAPTNERVGNC